MQSQRHGKLKDGSPLWAGWCGVSEDRHVYMLTALLIYAIFKQ
jgi:hypothetical protein